MGSGKTSVGKVLSKKIQRPFFDIDKEIIKRENLNISQIIHKLMEDQGKASYNIKCIDLKIAY